MKAGKREKGKGEKRKKAKSLICDFAFYVLM